MYMSFAASTMPGHAECIFPECQNRNRRSFSATAGLVEGVLHLRLQPEKHCPRQCTQGRDIPSAPETQITS